MKDAVASASYRIQGMDCAEEVASLRAELAKLPGITDLGFDILKRQMSLTFYTDVLAPSKIVEAVARTGMSASPWEAARESSDHRYRRLRVSLAALSGLATAAGFLVHALSEGFLRALSEATATPLLSKALYIVAAIAGAWFVAPKAWNALRNLRPDMNLLMLIAVAGAIGIGEIFEAATVAFLFSFSLTLEAWSVGRARRAIESLMSLAPEEASVIDAGGAERVVPAAEVKTGTTMVVRPGARFPLDGRITKGQTTVNQAPITGESKPVPKIVGDDVFAGTINEDGAVEAITTKAFEQSVLARIVNLVGDAQRKRSPSEQWVERFARIYTPVVLGLAVAAVLLGPLLFHWEWGTAIYNALALLVIACPCALVISTPVSIVAALAASARNGVLVKGGAIMELPARLRVIALDKTGTVTEGRPEVSEVVPLSGHSQEELLQIAAAVELRSEHHLARAIVSHAAAQGVRPPAAEGFQAIKGKGATAQVGPKNVWLGSHRLLEEKAAETPAIHDALEKLAAAGQSAVVVGEEDHVCGFIAIGDRIRPTAKAVIAEFKELGIERIVMLTGDNRLTAELVARSLLIDDVRAELLPEDKIVAIESLVKQYQHVAMVGDGVNDAPALARATLGIAMGGAGTDVALETADVVLMNDDLGRLPWLIRHSRRTLAIIRQNIVASLAVKAIFVFLALFGSASLWAAIAADMGMSLLVVMNGLRLLAPTTLRGQ